VPVSGATIESQVGAAMGLWTHTPVDWAGNEGPAKPGSWPNNAVAGQFSTATGTRPGNPGAPGAATSALVTLGTPSAVTTTTATINWTVAAGAGTSSRVEYGPTTAYGTLGAVQTGAGAKTTPLTGLTIGTTYHYRITATLNAVTNYTEDDVFSTLAA
jgi:hypothetical protein